jgi:hypothetical protein
MFCLFVCLPYVAQLQDHSGSCPPSLVILSYLHPADLKLFEMADANAVPGRIDILTFLELHWSLACLWIFYNTKQLHRFSTMSVVSGAKAETAQQARSLVRAPAIDFDLNALPLVLETLEGEEDPWSYRPTCYFQPYWFCELFSIVNYYGKASSSQRTTFENMPNEGRETLSGSIRMCKIPGRYKS